jgi:uncharacterized protein YbjT (DUF2867 family)
LTCGKRNIFVIGASGLIGSAVAARLHREGHAIAGLARTGRHGSAIATIAFDVANATTPEDWRPVLSGIEVVINCAGALQDGPDDKMSAVHLQGPTALFQACEQAGVKRVILLSAIGVERAQPSDFSKTKRQAEEALRISALDWIILRPSVSRACGPADPASDPGDWQAPDRPAR